MKLLWSLLLVSFVCAAHARHRHASRHDKDKVTISEDNEGNWGENFEKFAMKKSHNGYEEEELDPLKGVEFMEDEEEEDDNRKQDDGKVYSQDVIAEIQWQNRYCRPFAVNCGNRDGFYSVHSVFSRRYSDRLWSWACRRVTSHPYSHCHWSGDENAWTGNMNFTCPANQVLIGVHSSFVSAVADRRWRFRCCKSPRYYTTNCYSSEWTNTGEESIFHRVGTPRVFTGAASVYDHEKKDRVWKMKVCEYGTLYRARTVHRTTN